MSYAIVGQFSLGMGGGGGSEVNTIFKLWTCFAKACTFLESLTLNEEVGTFQLTHASILRRYAAIIRKFFFFFLDLVYGD